MTALLVTQDLEVAAHWQQAFPDGTSVRRLDPEVAVPVQAVVWLHVSNDLPGSLQQLAAIERAAKGATVVALADSPTDEQALVLMERGVSGYCHSRAAPEMLQGVATVVKNRGLWVGESLLKRLIRGAAAFPTPAKSDVPESANLTPRELEVTDAVLRGLSNKEIGREMGITERTVKAHLSAIFSKLDVRDRLHLAVYFKSHRPT